MKKANSFCTKQEMKEKNTLILFSLTTFCHIFLPTLFRNIILSNYFIILKSRRNIDPTKEMSYNSKVQKNKDEESP